MYFIKKITPTLSLDTTMTKIIKIIKTTLARPNSGLTLFKMMPDWSPFKKIKITTKCPDSNLLPPYNLKILEIPMKTNNPLKHIDPREANLKCHL
jgi:hypothetical protein